MGITSMQALVNGDVLIGTGEGKIHMTEKETFKPLKYLSRLILIDEISIYLSLQNFTSYGRSDISSIER